jgi:hypothetical protein
VWEDLRDMVFIFSRPGQRIERRSRESAGF